MGGFPGGVIPCPQQLADMYCRAPEILWQFETALNEEFHNLYGSPNIITVIK
jgi:hypothetical protein